MKEVHTSFKPRTHHQNLLCFIFVDEYFGQNVYKRLFLFGQFNKVQ